MSGLSNTNKTTTPNSKGPDIATPLEQSSTNDKSEKFSTVIDDETVATDRKFICQETKNFLELKEAINQLQVSFEEKIKYDSSKEIQISKLHSELQEHKNRLVFKILNPLVLDLITLHDNIGKVSAELRKTNPENNTRLYESFQTDIEDILFRYGYEAFATGDEVVEFDSKRQRVVKTITTTQASQDRKIAERLRKGFKYEDTIIRAEMVTVYTFQSAPAT